MNRDMRTVPPATEYFRKPPIEVGDRDVLVLCCLRNEVQRLPYFLQYYRRLGVRHFFVVDNASTDGSGEYLAAQEDVHVFWTDASYRGSAAGRLWMQELAAHYARRHWCLTVDVDELLVYPGVEYLSLRRLCDFLELENSEGLFCVFLDMYSDRPLGETLYTPGDDFLDVCGFFEIDTYRLQPGKRPPFLDVFGGPRGASFAAEGGSAAGPMMKKVPLVRWSEHFSYIFSTHSHIHVPLSETTGALLHFKFFHFFSELARYEAARGDRRQTAHYDHYSENALDDTCFFSQRSYRYTGSRDLVELGVVRASRGLKDFAAVAAEERGPAHVARVLDTMPNPSAPPVAVGGDFTLRHLASLWPFVHNHRVAEHFADGSVAHRFTDRKRFVARARDTVKVLDLDAEGLRLLLPEEVLYRYVRNGLWLVGYQGERFLFRIDLSADEPALSVDETALAPAVYRVRLDWAALAPGTDGPLEDVRFFIVPSEAVERLDMEGRTRSHSAALLGAEIFAAPVFQPRTASGDEALGAAGFDGVLERIDEQTAVGWVREIATDRWDRPVAFYLNGRFGGAVTPAQARGDLRGGGERPLGFRFQMPLRYFFENGAETVTIEVRPAGSNVALRRAPATVHGVGQFRWQPQQKTWLEVAERE